MIPLFCGYDPREAVGYHTFVSSVLKRASEPVAFTALSSMGLPEGSNSFTLSRFLVPYLCGFKGEAIFVDACDMLCMGDIAELWKLRDDSLAVQVVKHPDYVSKHTRKYVGTEMECEQSNYPRKNWASVMIINCEHPRWGILTPELLARWSDRAPWLLGLHWLPDDSIGHLPSEWNVLVDEDQEEEAPKLLHWTAGIPTFFHYRNARHSSDWFAQHEAISQGAQ